MRPFNHTFNRGRRIFFFILLAPVFFAVIGALVMLLWNAILPAVIHVGTINFWQALGILILSKILFSGFRHGYPGRHMHPHSKLHHLREKWESMTDEEKAKYKEEWKSCCHPNKE
jgi:hypothetical protein